MDPTRRKLLFRMIGAVVWLIGALIVLPILAYEGCHRLEVPQSYYADLDAARRDGSVLRGRVPPVLPESSRNIVEWHDLDTNKGEVKFEFDPRDAKDFLAQLTPEGTEYVYREPEMNTVFRFTVDAKRGRARARVEGE